MRGKLALGVSLLLVAVASFADTAAGQFAVQITLNNPQNITGNNNICTSATGSGTNSSSVQVRCTTNVYVNLATAKFLPGYRPARDSLLPDFCRNELLGVSSQAARMTCRLDDARRQLADAGDEADDGWKIESRLYAVDTDAAATQTQARLRLQDERGTLTSLRVAHAGGHSGAIEMLVSF